MAIWHCTPVENKTGLQLRQLKRRSIFTIPAISGLANGLRHPVIAHPEVEQRTLRLCAPKPVRRHEDFAQQIALYSPLAVFEQIARLLPSIINLCIF